MATVFKRGRFWWAQWYDGTGSRIAKSTKTEKKREAERIAALMEAESRKSVRQANDIYLEILRRATDQARAGKLGAKSAESFLLEIRRAEDENYRTLSLQDHLEEWMAAKLKRVGYSTGKNLKAGIGRFKRFLPSKVLLAPVADLTKGHIEAALHKMKASRNPPLVSATVNADLSFLREALKDAIESGLAIGNPATKVSKLPETDSSERAPFAPQEVATLLKATPAASEWRGLILFAAYTGLRLKDVASLGSGHVAGSELVIRPAKTVKKGKANTLRIPLAQPLRDWIQVRGKQGPFFPESAKTQAGVLSNQFKRLMKKAGVEDEVVLPGGIKAKRSFHSLRHSFTSWLAEADIHADVRRKLTGHATGAMHDLYTHRDESLKRAIDSLPDLASE